jgi:ribosomal protein S18 acetylase RimI-like enzyme
MSVSLREPTLADAERVAEVHVRSWKVGYRDLMPADFLAALEPAYRAKQYRDSWGHPDFAHVCGLVAESDGQLVGFVRYGPYRTAHELGLKAVDPQAGGEVYALYVDPSRWQVGAGGALLEAAVTELIASDLTPIYAWTLHGNARALRFYQRHGFVLDGHTQPIQLGQDDKIERLEDRLTLAR